MHNMNMHARLKPRAMGDVDGGGEVDSGATSPGMLKHASRSLTGLTIFRGRRDWNEACSPSFEHAASRLSSIARGIAVTTQHIPTYAGYCRLW